MYLKLVLTKTKRASCSGAVKIKSFFHSTKIPVWSVGNSTCQMEQNIPVTDSVQATAHLVIVLVSRIQKSSTGDKNFVKRQETFESDRRKWPDWSKWTTFKSSLEYSSDTKLKWHTLYQPKLNVRDFGLNGKCPKPPMVLTHGSYSMSVSFPLQVSCLGYHSFIRHGTKGRASKAFITKDKAGTSFLCYLLGQLNKLR